MYIHACGIHEEFIDLRYSYKKLKRLRGECYMYVHVHNASKTQRHIHVHEYVHTRTCKNSKMYTYTCISQE